MAIRILILYQIENNMTKETIADIQNEIDSIREYVETELCRKCEEMFVHLQHLEKLLEQYKIET